jgi:hypothetical protein
MTPRPRKRQSEGRPGIFGGARNSGAALSEDLRALVRAMAIDAARRDHAAEQTRKDAK